MAKNRDQTTELQEVTTKRTSTTGGNRLLLSVLSISATLTIPEPLGMSNSVAAP